MTAVKPGGAFLAYIEHLKACGQSAATLEKSRCDLSSFRNFLGRSIEELTSRDVSGYMRFMKTGLSPRTRRRYSRRACLARVNRIRHFLRFLAERGVIASDFGAGTSYFQMDLTSRDFVTPDEVARIMESVDTSRPIGVRDRAILEMIYGCGLRLTEAAELCTGDVDCVSAQVEIRKGDSVATMKRAEWSKGTLPRTLPIPFETKYWLSRYLNEIRPWIIEERGESDALFLDMKHSGGIGKGAIEKQVRDAREKSKVTKKNIGPTMLRDALGAHLILSGADPDAVMWFLGLSGVKKAATEMSHVKEILRYHPRHLKKK